jgi:hypothetical protein
VIDLLHQLGVLLDDPFVQQTLFALMCLVSSCVALVARDGEWNITVLCTLSISIFWAVNNFFWAFNTLELSPYTDGMFMLATLFVFWKTKLWWIGILSALFASNVWLDLQYIHHGLDYSWFAFWSNWVFGFELFFASFSGWKNVIFPMRKDGLSTRVLE